MGETYERTGLAAIEARLVAIEKMLRAVMPKPVADDKDLDSQHGDPVARFNPKRWDGEDCKGRKFSECPAEFLDLLAETFDYFAEQAEEKNEQYNGKPTAPYKRKDAARARGWAKRIRGGYKPASMDDGNDGF